MKDNINRFIILILTGICVAFFFTILKLSFKIDSIEKEMDELYKENVILRDENTELKWELEQIDYIVCAYEGMNVYE